MSSRALRKLQLGKDPTNGFEAEHLDGGSESCETDGDVPSDVLTEANAKTSKIAASKNLFSLLDDEDGGGEDGEEENVSPGTGKEEVKSVKPKRKKKNKRKGEKESKNVEEEDDIDISVRQIDELMSSKQNKLRNASDVKSQDEHHQTRKPILTIEHRHLNPENEVKRIFGSKVVEKDRPQRQHRGQLRRKTWLVKSKPDWERIHKTGLSMNLVENKNGLMYFAFEHSKSYQKIQFDFLDAVESFNPKNIIALLQNYPFHIDTLMQVSEMYRMNEDWEAAGDMIERALYVFENSFHSLFSLTQGTSRLDYRRNENRAFFLAMFHHLSFVGRRGCCRTALEFCKLILSLDPENDPLCMLLLIDHYAMRSDQYAFLVQLFEEWDSQCNLSLLPNFAFSVPLALYHLSLAGESKIERADEMVQRSLIMFPGFLFPLLDKCSISPDDAIKQHDFFSSKAQKSQTDELQQLIQLYIGRSHSCWKESGVMLWLEKNVRRVLERVDAKDPLIDQCTKKRIKTFRGTPRNIHRHILISEIKEAMTSLPPEVRLSPVLSCDPLPPPDSISSYERPKRPTRAQESSNPLSMFFRSMLPSFNPQEVMLEPEEGAVGGQPEGTELRQGIGVLMDAVRDLLNSVRLVPPPVENQARDGDNADEHDGPEEEDGYWD